MVTRMLFVRHGQTRFNAQGRYQGRSDVRLDAAGRRQAQAISCRLASTEIHAAYSSDLRRAWETGKIIAARQDIPLLREPRLREIDFGEWEGLTYREIQERYPEALTAWEAHPMAVPPPGGETFSEVATRVEKALNDIIRAHEGRTVLLVGHAGVLTIAICLLLGLSPALSPRLRLGPCSLSEVLLRPDGAVLTRLNEPCMPAGADDTA